MLSVQLKNGEYLTIGENIVVQVYQTGQGFRVAVEAPRDVPIVRGEVLERTGNRPACIHEEITPRHTLRAVWPDVRSGAKPWE